MVVFALGAVVLCALVGLVVDGGRAYVNRRALQGAGDAAAEAATHELLANFKATGTTQPGFYADADVRSVVCTIVGQASSGGSPTGTCNATGALSSGGVTAYYLDVSLTQLGPVGGGSIPSGAQSVQVTPRDNAHGTYLLRLVGQSSAQEAATATARFFYVQAVDDNALGHYAAWQISCVANRQIQVGDDLVFRSNSWKTSAACGQSGISSNNFKGWFHNSTDCGIGPVSSPPSTCSPGTAVTTFSQSQWINSAGGNAIGQESADIAKCDSAFNNHVPMFIPIMDFASGNGSNLQMHVAGFVGLIPDQLCSGTPPYTDWSGRVVAFSNFPDGKPCTGPGCPPPTGFEPVNFGLVR